MIHSGGLCVLLYVTVSTESVVAMALQCWHSVNLYSTHYDVFYLTDYYTCADKPIFNNRLHGGNFSFYYVDVILWWEAFPQKSFQIWKLFWYRCALPDHRLALHTSNLKYNTCNLHYVICLLNIISSWKLPPSMIQRPNYLDIWYSESNNKTSNLNKHAIILII